MRYFIFYTPEFKRNVKRFRKNYELISEIKKAILLFKKNPFSKGKILKGNLHPNRSVRILGKYRLIFEVKDLDKEVVLKAFNHRKSVYRKMR